MDMIILGESIFNDGVSIVVFEVFRSLMENMSALVDHGLVIGLSITKLLYVVIGSVIMGIMFAMICVFVTKFTAKKTILDPLLIAVFAFLAFYVAEAAHLSGILSILFAGITLSRYIEFNLTSKTLK